VAFDGRLDHREDLCAALGVPAGERNVPDPELVLRALARWDTEGVARLEGEFAFAAWDGRRRELLCARSVFSPRPFYYHFSLGRFVWASSIRAVLLGAGLPRAVEETYLGCLLGGVPRAVDTSMYAGVKQLPAGSWLRLRLGGAPEVRAFWQLKMEPEIVPASPAAAAEQLRDLLDRAVRSALRSRHPVAAMVSGGLDSSGVAALAARELAAREMNLVTVSTRLPAGFTGELADREEAAFAEAVLAQHPNMQARWAEGERFPVLSFDDGWYARRDVPSGDTKWFRTAELAELAAGAGSAAWAVTWRRPIQAMAGW
jgi:asparagine synthase (glutamine-hydrolysing)